MPLVITANPELMLKKGDFSGEVRAGAFEVPRELFELLVAFGIRDAESFFESVYRIPDRLQVALEKSCDWSVSDYMAAASRLGSSLDGHLPEHRLYPCGRPRSRKK